MTSSIVDSVPDLLRVRRRASRFLSALIWLHAPIVGVMAVRHHTGWPLQLAIAVLLASVASLFAWWRPTTLTTRMIVAAALTGMPILFVFNGAGPWQIDYHMYFFAIFAMLVAFCDWRPIVLSAILTASHHIIFDIVDRSAVFPTDGGIDRLALHATIVAVECGVLIWIIAQVRALFLASAQSRALAEQRLEAAERAAETIAHNAVLELEVAERKRSEARLLQIALHDDLTGLRNRSYLIDAVDGAITRAKHDPTYRFALLFIDLDRFKLVNDSLGHRVGDLLLIGIAARLRLNVRSVDTLARLGGDEFALLLDGTDDVARAAALAERIGDSLTQPFSLSGNELFGSASIGIADSTRGYAQAEEMLRAADSAMYEAKRRNGGRGGYVVYEPAMDVKASAALTLQQDLRKAIERQEFCLYYQPIVRLDTAEIIGFEALVRWQHPQRGLLAPAEFIAIAEQTGLIVGLGSWVLREACRQMREWVDRFGTARLNVMSVNLSSRQMGQPSFGNDLDAILAETGIDPRRLQLEITESVLLGNVGAVGTILAGLRDRGIRIAFDDFGTGYSSLSYLQRYRVDTLKIDQSFVRGIEDNASNIEIIKAVVALARTLKIDVNAEGVETARQLYAVKALGCSTAQGFYFSRAIPASEVPAMLADWAMRESGGRIEYATS